MVSDLLTASHAAHRAYRDAITRQDRTAARVALQGALDARVAAQAEDPTFSDAAWAEESGAYPHVSLLVFYREQLSR